MEIALPKMRCKRCGHEWYLRRPKLPEVCPKCASRFWNDKYPPKLGRPRKDKSGGATLIIPFSLKA